VEAEPDLTSALDRLSIQTESCEHDRADLQPLSDF
jgi:hypothetical protein